MMKMASGVLGIVLVATCGAAALAQTEAPAPKVHTTTSEPGPATYRLTYTVTEMDAAKHLGTQHFSLTINADTRNSELKLGSKVPIATGAYHPNSPSEANVQFQYVDVGLNISARLGEYNNGIEVYSKLEQSSVAEEQSTVDKSDPVIRQTMLQNTALVTIGKPVILGSLDVPGSTRHLDIELVVEVVR